MSISVIIPCYNYANFLTTAIESVLNQTYNKKLIEIIVVNDGSSDMTMDVAMRYPVTVLNQSHLGVSIARNNGILYSSGQFILPLDADDKIHPQFLEKTMSVLKRNSSIGIAYTHRKHFGDFNTVKYARQYDVLNLKKKNFLNYCSLFRREVWVESGGYNSQMSLGYEDWDFWLSIAEKTKWEFKLVDEVLFYYRRHKSSLRHIAKKNHKKLLDIIKVNHPVLYNQNSSQK